MPVANWEDQMLLLNISCGPKDNAQPRRSRDGQQTVLLHFSGNWFSCSSWIALVKPIHFHFFNFLVIFVFDQDYSQDKYLNVFKPFEIITD